MRYYVVIDPRMHDPELLFRTPDHGGPPTELWDPSTGEWDEDVSLISYFTGDMTGAIELDGDSVDEVQTTLKETPS